MTFATVESRRAAIIVIAPRPFNYASNSVQCCTVSTKRYWPISHNIYGRRSLHYHRIIIINKRHHLAKKLKTLV